MGESPAETSPRNTQDTLESAPPESSAPADGAAPALSDPAIAEFLASVAPQLPPDSGLAIAPLGRAEAGGKLGVDGAAAWSTIKVPLAIAALRAGLGGADDVHSAITVSDNEAAQRLWDALGGGEPAASAVEQVLREGGDTSTDVPATPTRAGVSIFGQTQWTVAEQVRFAAQLPCLAGAETVLDEMGQIDPTQRWGLGALPGARFKGGWGPLAEGGGYVARQFGIVPTSSGQLAVAITAQGADFGAAQHSLGTIVAALEPALAQLPGGQCTP